LELAEYQVLKTGVIRAGYKADIDWAENIKPPTTPEDFAAEIIFVICNSGMKAQIARAIFDRVVAAIKAHTPLIAAFGHKGKVAAIENVWGMRKVLFDRWKGIDNWQAQLDFAAALPWIGEITKYHVVKNFGAQVAKPDRHLMRIASHNGMSPQAMCERISKLSGDSVSVVDTVIWRAANLGMI